MRHSLRNSVALSLVALAIGFTIGVLLTSALYDSSGPSISYRNPWQILKMDNKIIEYNERHTSPGQKCTGDDQLERLKRLATVQDSVFIQNCTKFSNCQRDLAPTTPVENMDAMMEFLYPQKEDPIVNFKDSQRKMFRPISLTDEYIFKKGVLVGVLTQQEYLATRAKALYETWGKGVDKLVLFVGEDCNISANLSHLPIVKLEGVPDGADPSLKKTFAMMKYMYSHHINEFDWFIRADDDMYLRADRLKDLLNQMNPCEQVYLGRAGAGRKEDLERLKLLPHERYCMGGPGVILSNGAMRGLGPHLDNCLNAVLYHDAHSDGKWKNDDVEIGRCLSRKVDTQCSSSAEAESFFFADYSNQPLTSRYLSETNHFLRLITYHPVPSPEAMLEIHYHYKQSEFKQLIKKARIAKEDLKLVCTTNDSHEKSEIFDKDCEISLCPCENDGTVQARCPSMGVVTELSSGYQPTNIYDIQAWQYFDDRVIYSDLTVQPSYRLHSQKNTKHELQEMLGNVVQAASEWYGQKLRLKKLVNGWVRHNPSRGSEYIVDGLFIDGFQKTVKKRINFVRPLATNYITQKDSGDAHATVTFVVPITKVNERFREFITMYYENLGLASKENVKLILAVYGKDDIAFVNKVLEPLHDKYPEASVTVVEGKGEFSRSRALHLGMSKLHPKELAFLCDVDITISHSFLDKCRKNTVRGKRVYYPEVFKLYNLDYIYYEKKRPSEISLKRTHGHWAYYAYGMLCIYKSDYDDVGGLNTTIVGWGDEDVNFFEKVLRKRLDVLRAPDTSLSHRWHEKNCPKTLSVKQLQHCFSSQGEILADRIELANYIFKKGVQLNHSTSLPTYSPQLVVYGKDTQMGDSIISDIDHL